jgi:hypothetical protein
VTLTPVCFLYAGRIRSSEQLATALEIDILELFSIKTIELYEKKELKNVILADIDHILAFRLLEGEKKSD